MSHTLSQIGAPSYFHKTVGGFGKIDIVRHQLFQRFRPDIATDGRRLSVDSPPPASNEYPAAWVHRSDRWRNAKPSWRANQGSSLPCARSQDHPSFSANPS